MAEVTGIIDSDGHVVERGSDLYPYLESKYPRDGLENYPLFPTLDGFRRGNVPRGYNFDLEGWSRFMKDSTISYAVLYPTAGLGYAFTKDPEWATDLAQAYNNFLSDAFIKKDSRFNAMAMLPVQDPPAAAKELRRAVKELGMVGGLLPTPGLRIPYGDTAFDVLYKEAQSLDVPLAVHGAAQQGIGLDILSNQNQGQILAHAFAQMIQFVNMIWDQVFERFPTLKVVYQEAGAGWVPFLMERLDRRSSDRMGRKLASEQIRNHPIYFHAELEEQDVLVTALDVIGNDRFVYASDFPHENGAEIIEGLIEFQNREDITQESKERVLRDNIKALYGLK